MTIESASYISQLQPSYPADGDIISEGDNHLRLLKTVLQGQFPNFTAAAVNATPAELNNLAGVAANIASILQAADYAAVRTLLDVPTNAQAILQSLLTTEGDTVVRGASVAERLAIGSEGQVKQVLSGSVVWGERSLELSTVDMSVGGTTIALTTSVPAWARRITLPISRVSVTGSTDWGIRIGPSAGVVSTGYDSECMRLAGDGSNLTASLTNGFRLARVGAGGNYFNGVATLEKVGGSHQWILSAQMMRSGGNFCIANGEVTLAGPLTDISAFVNGSDEFDAGEIGIKVEG